VKDEENALLPPVDWSKWSYGTNPSPKKAWRKLRFRVEKNNAGAADLTGVRTEVENRGNALIRGLPLPPEGLAEGLGRGTGTGRGFFGGCVRISNHQVVSPVAPTPYPAFKLVDLRNKRMDSFLCDY
jgi:hypothetical protein